MIDDISKDINMIPVDGDELPMSQAEFAARIAETHDPSLLGDWYVKKSDYPPVSDIGQPISGRISYDLKAYLDAFGPGEIEDRIKHFKSDMDNFTGAEEVREAVWKTLVPGGWRSLVKPFPTVIIPAWSTYLYRVRKDIKAHGSIRTVGDIWTPPSGTRSGRLNREGQPVLYASALWPVLAIRESRVRPGEIFALSCFAIKDDLWLFDLDDTDPQTPLNTKQRRKWKALSEFYRWAFQHSGTNSDRTRHLLSQVLILDFNLLHPRLIGYNYQSVLAGHPNAINVALDEQEASNRLRLMGTTIFEHNGTTGRVLKSFIPQRQSLNRSTPLIPGNLPEAARIPVKPTGKVDLFRYEDDSI